MRQIEDFSTAYSRLAWECVAYTAGLIIWVWITVLLHWRGYDIRTIYVIVAIVIGLCLFRAVTRLNREERRIMELYSNYLDTFSYQALYQMSKDENLSDWSKRSILRYLDQAFRLQY